MFNRSDGRWKDAEGICSHLDGIQTTVTSIEIEKFTGDWLQKWEVKGMEITLDRHGTMLAKTESPESYKSGEWRPGQQARSILHPGFFSFLPELGIFFLFVWKIITITAISSFPEKSVLCVTANGRTSETSEKGFTS